MDIQYATPKLQLPSETWDVVEDDLLCKHSQSYTSIELCCNLDLYITGRIRDPLRAVKLLLLFVISQFISGFGIHGRNYPFVKFSGSSVQDLYNMSTGAGTTVYNLLNSIAMFAERAKGLLNKIVFTTVITDLCTCHPTWFHKLVTRCYCPSPEVAKRALKADLQPSRIKIYGLPVRPSVVKPVREKDQLRTELGMDKDLPAVLLMGGGEGMGPIEATARALDDALYDENLMKPIGQILVTCGRNIKLANKLVSIDWKIPVQVKGFVTKIEECMGACDCVITKAGLGTIAEAMIRGLPIILNDYIAGQEVGNVPYVVENGCPRMH